MNKPETIPCRGRKREFCVEEALAAALRVFWSKGFEGTSLNDLTEAMGITRPSLYLAFGNKESLFRKTLDLYEREKMAYIGKALAQPTAREVARTMLEGAVNNATSASEPHGCLGVITSVACGTEAETVRKEVLERAKAFNRAIVERFEKAKAEGEIPAHIDVEGLTNLLRAMLQGISVQAGGGASREQLEKLVETGLMVWPTA